MVNKRGASLVELIAVIIIMGVIAGIAVPTVIAVINRQRRNATINALNEIYNSAISLLLQVETESYDPNITLVDEDFCYISLTTLIDSGNVDGNDYYPQNEEVYFCYNFNSNWVVITNGEVSKEKPTSTGTSYINKLDITFDFDNDSFKVA
ncbi:MAG: type II secretion system protein [Acholeplasmatales bacterium]|nr:type II secretion system protein [Acholeplasmatales bacterium]